MGKPDTGVAYGPGVASGTPTADYGWHDGSFVRITSDVDPTTGVVVPVYTPLDPAVPSDRYEIFSYAAEPRSMALGAQAGVFGPFTGEVNMQDFGFTGNQDDHSAQFCNTNSLRSPYWSALLSKFGIMHNT
jgi:hypothetical protein